METAELKEWALDHGTSAVADHPDKKLSLTSKLLRFRWQGAHAVAVAQDAAAGTRINSVLNGLSWFLATRQPGEDTVHVIIGDAAGQSGGSSFPEHLDALRTLVSCCSGGPTVKLWTLPARGDAIPVDPQPAVFKNKKPEQWAALLASAASMPVTGVAAELVRAIDHPAFALYPKLSSQAGDQPWQMRLDGLEVGRAGSTAATLALNSSDLSKVGEPRSTWTNIVGTQPIAVDTRTIPAAARLVHGLIAAWTPPGGAAPLLRHGQPEHALEAHVLSGRLAVKIRDVPLRLAVEPTGSVLRAAQFPTLWGNVTRPVRYLDALLADDQKRPWAIELKYPQTGGHGSYLRHGIGQAILYRHYIRTAGALEPWFATHRLQRASCQAAVAFPTAKPGTEATITAHRELAKLFDVEIVELDVVSPAS